MNEPKTFVEAVRIVTWHMNHQAALRNNGIEFTEAEVANLFKAAVESNNEELFYEGMWRAGAYPADIRRAFALYRQELA